MQHLYLFYIFVAFTAGLVASGVVVFLYVRTKAAIIRYYLFFFGAFSLLTVSSLGLAYIYANFPGIEENANMEFVGAFSGALTMVATAAFMHFLVAERYAVLKNTIVGAVSLLVVLSYPISVYLAGLYALIGLIVQGVAYTLFLGVFLYISLLGLFRAKGIDDPFGQHITRLFSRMLLLLLPVFLLDFFILDDLLGIAPIFFPLVYAGISTIFLMQFMKVYGHHPVPQEGAAFNDEMSLDTLFEHYSLSPREQDVARLVLEGCSNQEIGEKLFISLSTVKTHVSNTYQKVGVKNRVDFITFVQNARTNIPIPPIWP
jgi:DNA-binding CsgD family transcriptional regulator